MYNLFVSALKESWEGEPFTIERDRFLEYTDNKIKDEFNDLNESKLNQIKRFPCVFAYEKFCKKDPKFGLINEIIERRKEIRINYEIISLDQFLTAKQLDEYRFELDILKWELGRTHWAIKDIDLPRELNSKKIKLPDWSFREKRSVDISKHEFKVSFSFPGEIREFIEPIVAELERTIGPNSYFYDNNYKAQLARPSLDTLLQSIYKERSKLIVVFLCEKYQDKNWCGIEFNAIREIIFEKLHDKIMYIKMDDGKVDGVFKTDGYIDGRTHSPREIADFIKTRIDLIESNVHSA